MSSTYGIELGGGRFGLPRLVKLSAPRNTIPEDAALGGKANTWDSPFSAAAGLTTQRVKDIKNDPVVKFALRFMAMPVTRVKAKVEGDDKDQVAFLESTLLPILPGYLKMAANARVWGYQAMEARYQLNPDGRIVLKPFRFLDPTKTAIKEGPDGKLTAIEYSITTPATVLPAELGKFILITNRAEETTSRYGISDFDEVWLPYSRKRTLLTLMSRYCMKHADPPVITYFRERIITSPNKANEKQADIALGLSKGLRSGEDVSIALDDEGNRIYDPQAFTVENRIPLFVSAIEFQDVQMLRGLLVPERSLTQGQTATGTNAMARTHGDFLVLAQEDFADTLLQPLNDHIVPKELVWNFGQADPTVKVTHEGLLDEDAQMIRDVAAFLFACAQNGTPLTADVVAWLRKRTGIPIDESAMIEKAETPASPVATSPRRTPAAEGAAPEEITTEAVAASEAILALSERRTALRRKMTPREEELGGARYLLSMANEWADGEQSLMQSLLGILRRQEERYLAAVKRAMAAGNKSSQLKAAREIGLQLAGEFEAAIKAGYTSLAEFGARRVYSELGIRRYPGLTNLVKSSVLAEAQAQSETVTGLLLQKVRGALRRGITGDKTYGEVAMYVKDTFDGFFDTAVATDLLRGASQCVNLARAQVEQEKLDDPIVSATRIEAMDETTCDLCERLDGMTIDINDPDLRAFTPPSMCLGGNRCRGILAYNMESMDPELRTVDYKPLPQGMLDKVRFK